jgi:hypothetical protein
MSVIQNIFDTCLLGKLQPRVDEAESLKGGNERPFALRNTQSNKNREAVITDNVLFFIES